MMLLSLAVAPAVTPPLYMRQGQGWMFWFWKEYSQGMNMPEEVSYIMLGVILISGGIGAAIGISWDRKVIRSCNEIIAQLKE